MPGSILQASQGGPCPRTTNLTPVINITNFEVQGEDDHQDRQEEGAKGDAKPRWVQGGKEEDNRRYRDLLQYMEDKRKEDKDRLSQEEDKKKEAKKKQDSWALLRLSISYLKEKEGAWRQRSIEECDRIREEEKKDRLAVVKEKKKRYGISRLSKEENQKIKLRTEERLEVAKAKENLWKRFREGKKGTEIEEEEIQAWETVKKSVMELEEKEGD